MLSPERAYDPFAANGAAPSEKARGYKDVMEEHKLSKDVIFSHPSLFAFVVIIFPFPPKIKTLIHINL